MHYYIVCDAYKTITHLITNDEHESWVNISLRNDNYYINVH